MGKLARLCNFPNSNLLEQVLTLADTKLIAWDGAFFVRKSEISDLKSFLQKFLFEIEMSRGMPIRWLTATETHLNS